MVGLVGRQKINPPWSH